MVCANPDLEVIRGGRKIICAGSLALRYEELGGAVRWLGKPRAEIYEYCFRELSHFDKSRIAAIGDSFRTDLAALLTRGWLPSSLRLEFILMSLAAGLRIKAY